MASGHPPIEWPPLTAEARKVEIWCGHKGELEVLPAAGGVLSITLPLREDAVRPPRVGAQQRPWVHIRQSTSPKPFSFNHAFALEN
jgi:hypothetical protein